jgi:hypothetical protein
MQGVTYVEDETVLIEALEPSQPSDGKCRYALNLKPPWAGTLLYEVRAMPQHPNLAHPYELGLMRKL